MHKWEIIARIVAAGLVPVIRADTPERARRLVEAVAAGGVQTVEVTMTVPDALSALKEAKATGVLAGAGTVLDAETARLCILSGAEYLVTPGVAPDVIRMGHRYQKPVLVGAQTVTEVIRALEEGADIVKLFPGSHLGPDFLKALKGPLPQAPCMPTGGVTLGNVSAWLKAGAVAVGVGGELTAPGSTGDYAAVTDLARQFVAAVKEARA
ncbi:MAG TPA: bifunctional 2-keto-4-hydroxyglutarate aldolase/2-keto-3-deoxy-6-phosphogluconate aldolase [Symbiobacteriaceae bacterium]|nr:bifunctional 2-keto-4-hydroxyglutarate aldolase/2-keto-3-deoxy-6-phosphogluconate aldolase [Symbiobacteriaceae bacterium]